jgi:hypothetical protein
MKRFVTSFGWLMLLLPLISVAGVRTVVNTLSSQEERQVSGFTGISTSGSYDVFVKLDGKESLQLEGDANEISKIETVVEHGILKIRNKKNLQLGWKDGKKVTVYVTAKTLNNLMVSGSGNMKIDGIVKAGNLQAKVSGSGNMDLNASANSLRSVVSGSGSLNIAGTAKDADIVVSGSGNFRGKDLRTHSADIKVSGSGNVKVYADTSIDAALSGSGSINYAGNASVTQAKSGSGSISKF